MENSKMRERFAEIIQMIESADDLFKQIDTGMEEARALWDAGIERLAAAIWICEREEEKS
jgi:predicted NBD/HSP70 family sugar kinase